MNAVYSSGATLTSIELVNPFTPRAQLSIARIGDPVHTGYRSPTASSSRAM